MNAKKESLGQLLDAVGNYLANSRDEPRPRLKLILLSRPQPAILESKLGQYRQIRLDNSDAEISHDVERYIFAKVAELASEQDLSEDMVAQVQRALLAGADGTFLWVGFVTDELEGRSWDNINEILPRVPIGLGGVYQQQIDDTEALVPILQWAVLAARPVTVDELTVDELTVDELTVDELTVDELTVAVGIQTSGTPPANEAIKRLPSQCGLLVKIEGDAIAHRWLIGEAIPEALSASISELPPGPLQKRTYKTLVECLLLGKQYGLALPAAVLRQRVEQHPRSLPGVEHMKNRVVGP